MSTYFLYQFYAKYSKIVLIIYLRQAVFFMNHIGFFQLFTNSRDSLQTINLWILIKFFERIFLHTESVDRYVKVNYEVISYEVETIDFQTVGKLWRTRVDRLMPWFSSWTMLTISALREFGIPVVNSVEERFTE